MAANILVVDDDELMRELLRLQLSGAGYEVQLAEDAIVAGRALIANPPDLVLADIAMPFMSGLELLEAMKSDPATSSIPVIIITCRTEAEREAMQLGAAAFLSKPVRVGSLLALIARHLSAPAYSA
jgi:CheY-like chemotaxis protein